MRSIGQGNGLVLTGTSGTFEFSTAGAPALVKGVYLIYDSAAPATTVFTFSNMGRNFFVSAAGNTDQYFDIRNAAYGANGAALSTGNPYVETLVNGIVTVAISAAAASAGAGYGCLIFLSND